MSQLINVQYANVNTLSSLLHIGVLIILLINDIGTLAY